MRDGIGRQVGEDTHCWVAHPGDWLEYRFPATCEVRKVELVLDSAMERSIALRGPGWQEPFPDVMPRTFRIETFENGRWMPVRQVDDNVQRFVAVPVERLSGGVRFVLERTWGAPASRVYAFLVHSAAVPSPRH